MGFNSFPKSTSGAEQSPDPLKDLQHAAEALSVRREAIPSQPTTVETDADVELGEADPGLRKTLEDVGANTTLD